MFKEFFTYYFIHNDHAILPVLMVYMIVGTGTGLVMVISEWLLDYLARDSPVEMGSLPSFLKLVTFWLPWLMLGLAEVVCKRWFPLSYYTASLNKRLSNWISVER